MFHFTVLVFSFLFYGQSVFSATVDQRQTGDLNVQIDLKNLQIVGLMKGKEEYVDYDYAYDYSEMTIKPPNGTTTTKKPLNVTETVTDVKGTAATTLFAEVDLTTSSIENKSSTEEGVTIPDTVYPTPKPESNGSSTEINNSTIKPPQLDSTEITSSNFTSSTCKKGFFRNNQGNCEFKLQNPSNALLKMIKQKVKMNMSNGVRQP